MQKKNRHLGSSFDPSWILSVSYFGPGKVKRVVLEQFIYLKLFKRKLCINEKYTKISYM